MAQTKPNENLSVYSCNADEIALIVKTDFHLNSLFVCQRFGIHSMSFFLWLSANFSKNDNAVVLRQAIIDLILPSSLRWLRVVGDDEDNGFDLFCVAHHRWQHGTDIDDIYIYYDADDEARQ